MPKFSFRYDKNLAISLLNKAVEEKTPMVIFVHPKNKDVFFTLLLTNIVLQQGRKGENSFFAEISFPGNYINFSFDNIDTFFDNVIHISI